MKIYFAAHGNKTIIEQQILNGWGMMASTFNWRTPVVGLPWALDNGAYSAWINDLPFPEDLFFKILNKISLNNSPDFIVCPDIVCGGLSSLQFSLQWLPKLPKEYNYYLSVQDGMKEEDVIPHINKFEGIFVGGSIRWKLRMGEKWCQFAHEHRKHCHIGRIGTFKNLVFARFAGADSIDSSTFIQGLGRLKRIKRAKGQLHLTHPHNENIIFEKYRKV